MHSIFTNSNSVYKIIVSFLVVRQNQNNLSLNNYSSCMYREQRAARKAKSTSNRAPKNSPTCCAFPCPPSVEWSSAIVRKIPWKTPTEPPRPALRVQHSREKCPAKIPPSSTLTTTTRWRRVRTSRNCAPNAKVPFDSRAMTSFFQNNFYNKRKITFTPNLRKPDVELKKDTFQWCLHKILNVLRKIWIFKKNCKFEEN